MILYIMPSDLHFFRNMHGKTNALLVIPCWHLPDLSIFGLIHTATLQLGKSEFYTAVIAYLHKSIRRYWASNFTQMHHMAA